MNKDLTTTTCPEQIRTNTRRKNLKKKWGGKEWKVAREKFIQERGAKCEWCKGTERLTVHHPQRNGYGDQVYLNFYLSGCVLLCSRCHAALHAGKVLCEREHADGENHYRWHDAEMCSYCFLQEHPEIKELAEIARSEKRKRQRELRKAQAQKAKEWKKENGGKKK